MEKQNDLEKKPKEEWEKMREPGDSEFIFKRRSLHAEGGVADDKFEVVVPKKSLIVLIIIFAVLYFAQFFYFSGLYIQVMYPEVGWNPEWYYWWAPLIFLAIAIVPILAWGEIGSRLASTSIVKYLKKTVNRKMPKPAEIILGYPIRTKDIYYLEAYPVDLDLGGSFAHTKKLLTRVFEVVSISLGMSVIITQIVAPYLWAPVYAWDPDMYWNVEEMMIDLALYLGPFTLLILTFIMPIFWISEDTQAYRVDQYQDVHRLGYYLRSGLLSKILGFFGIVLVYNLAEAFATALLLDVEEISYAELMTSPALAFELFTTTFIWFGLIILMGSAIPFLVAIVYLSYFHQKWVNNVRVRASEFMDLGTLNIRKPKKDNLKYMNKPEMIDETGRFGGFFQTKNGKIILIVLIIVAAVICIYMGFIYGFEPAFGWV
ncbi:MAG: hypothetical protein ACOCT9_02755 [archaeon]